MSDSRIRFVPFTFTIGVAMWIGTTAGAADIISVKVGTNPGPSAWNLVTNEVLVTNLRSNSVSVIDSTTYSVSTVNTEQGPADVAVNVVTG